MIIEILDATDSRLIECYKMRYQVYCSEKKWLSAENYSNQEETDEYDQQSIHIAMFSDNKLEAYCRLILPHPKDLPIKEHINVDFHRDKCIEISRFIVADQKLGLNAHIEMFTFISHYLAEHGYVYALASVEKPLLRIIRMYGMDVQVLSKPMYYFGGLLTPIYIHVFDKLEEME